MAHWQEKFDLKNPQTPAIMFSSIEFDVIIWTGIIWIFGTGRGWLLAKILKHANTCPNGPGRKGTGARCASG